MINTILEILNIQSNNYKKANEGVFTHAFYQNIDTDNIKNRTELICNAFGKPYDEELFNRNLQIAINQHKAITPVTIQESSVLKVNANIWLTDHRQKNIGWNNGSFTTYRERYFEYLKRIGRNENIVNETRRSTLNIVGNLGDPRGEEGFYTKGMVVGSVQSGKTANFNGVINTAIDAGYKMIIVLSGIMEDLRVQTQARIEKEVTGPRGVGGRASGVGAIHPFDDNLVSSITSQGSDFNRNLLDADFDIFNKNILVVKKNVHILKNILLWLKGIVDEQSPQIDIPLLIIDDECDNASLNNIGQKGPEYATKTNAEIRAILAMFSKKSYLGYTATPFANVFQDRNEKPIMEFTLTVRKIEYKFDLVDNLFPEHFIELLKPPSNYVGIKHFFDTKSDEINKIESLIAKPIDLDDPNYYMSLPPRFLKDNDLPTTSRIKGTRAAKKDDNYPNAIPRSLKEAIHCFILSIAIRESRKDILKDSPFYQPHHTMLIHISLFGSWQNRLKDLIEVFVSNLTKSISHDSLDSSIFVEFERVWIKHFDYIVNNIQNELPSDYIDEYLTPKEYHSDIKPLLIKAVEDIEVVAVNSYTNTDLNYKNSPKKYIAVGGNRLSRGFTLEGLTINYFLRKANTADTLMQMGRWFGYRTGYLDCCKLFTTSDNIDKFNEASKIIEDLEEKFKYLSELPGRTPGDFTLWVQNNPDVIKLTRANFLRGITTKNLSFEDTVQQSTQFIIEKDKLDLAFKAFKKKFSKIEWKKLDEHPNYIVHDTNQNGLLEFIDLPNVMLNLNILGLREYLESCAENNKLKNWRIAINVGNRAAGKKIELTGLNRNYQINRVKRSGPGLGKNTTKPSLSYSALIDKNIFKARNSTIITPDAFALSLSREEINRIKLDYSVSNPRKTVPDREYRRHMDSSQGLLIIYLIDLVNVFNVDSNDYGSFLSLNDYALKRGIDRNFQSTIPLIGYALGFPTNIGVNGAEYVAQHVHREPEDMNLEELKKFVSLRDFDIDLEDDNWTKESLLEAIYDNPKNDEEDLLSDDNEFTFNNN